MPGRAMSQRGQLLDVWASYDSYLIMGIILFIYAVLVPGWVLMTSAAQAVSMMAGEISATRTVQLLFVC